MEQRKGCEISIFVACCIIINLIGKNLAEVWELPLWMDSFGTVLAAYTMGPVCGAVVGVAVNIITNFARPIYMVYGLTSVSAGVLIGILKKKRYLENLFGILSAGFLLAICSVVISTPLNYFLFDGYTGNKWGDGVIDLLQRYGTVKWLSCIVGEYYVDFIDKVMVLTVLYVGIRLFRRYKDKMTGNKAAAGGIRFIAVPAVGLLLCSAPVEAAEAVEADYNAWHQVIYDDMSGLPGGIANDIAETGDGVLWIGTYGGLYRYSGKEFKFMNEFESIKNVNCFYSDREGRLWIGTNDNGFSICINNEIVSVMDESNGLPADSVRCITAGMEGIYYVGTTGSLAIVNLSSGLSLEGVVPDIVYAKSLSADERGYAAAVTDEGRFFLLEGDRILSDKKLDARGERYNCCAFSHDGELYVGTTGSRIIIYTIKDGELREKAQLSCGNLSGLNSINFQENGNAFICAENGVGYLDGQDRFHAVNTNQFNSCIDHMLFDYQGNIWFTSSRQGLLEICETPFTEIFGKLQIPGRVVNAIIKWQGNFFFGTDSGLVMADGALTGTIESELVEQLKGVRIRSLFQDSRGALWICTSGSGAWHVSDRGEITVYDSSAGTMGDKFRCVLESGDGVLALAGDSGISFVEHGVVTHTIGYEDGLDNPKVLCLLEGLDGALLAGTDGNGIAVIRDGKVVDTIKKEQGLSSKVILRMVKDPQEKGIYIVTSNSICFMNQRGEIQVLNNFPYYNNYDVIPGLNGELFVPGSAGIYVVDRNTLLSGRITEYTLLNSEKGLGVSLTANAWDYIDEYGNLYLAGDTGVAAVNLNSYQVSRSPFRMNLKSVQVDGMEYSVSVGETVKIPKEAGYMVISPEIVNFSANDPYVSYYLEGYDEHRQICLLSELKDLTYTNLSAGSSRFHLAVLDDRGRVISENIYHIEKEKDIFENRWFLLYVAFVFILTIIYLTWLIFRTQIQKTLNIQRRELDLAKKQVEMSNEAILAVARTMDAKDGRTSRHSFRVSEYAVLIAEKLGFSEEAREELRRTALLHDIGKIGIPDSILNKPSKLTEEEYALMKTHVVKGAEILRGFTSVAHIVEGAQYHHERYDGTGYVEGLKGEEIPLNARIIGIADTFDAMTVNRVYRGKMDFDQVLEELEKGRGTQFDPRLVDVMLELINDGTIRISQLYGENGGMEEQVTGGEICEADI